MDFNELVLSLTKQILRGKVTSYGELARFLGDIKLARAVGQALKKNSEPIKIPCHRVVCSDGRIGGYSRGIPEKIRLLRSEGIVIRDNRVQNFKKIFFSASEMKLP